MTSETGAAQRVVLAVDSFKGTITAAAAAEAIATGWRAARPGDEIVLRPMADGGEGTLDAFAASVPAAVCHPVGVTGPAGSLVDTAWLRLPTTGTAPGGTAVVELAATCGLELLGGQRYALDASTRGFGEATADALGSGVSRLVLGIGGSASTDGGVGMLTALGARFTDADGEPVAAGGRGLVDLVSADLSALTPPPAGTVALTDVTSPLLGPAGAAAVFGPQKGASPGQIALLEHGLERLARVLEVDPSTPGAGAAGGTGYALLAWGAGLVPGAAAVAGLIGLREAIASASVVITGEGSFDAQSAAGKVPQLVVELAADAGVPVALVAGRISPHAPTAAFADTVSLIDLAGSADAATRDPATWLREAGRLLAQNV